MFWGLVAVHRHASQAITLCSRLQFALKVQPAYAGATGCVCTVRCLDHSSLSPAAAPLRPAHRAVPDSTARGLFWGVLLLGSELLALRK